MGRLIYTAITSADGCVEDASGSINWSEPSEEVVRFIIDLERPAGTYLYGRRMYESMVYWETAHAQPDLPPWSEDFIGMWKAAHKVVFSRTLTETASERTRIERDFSPALVRQLKEASHEDLTVSGAEIAGQALKAGLLDEVRLFVYPIVIGGGKPALPLGARVNLELLATQRFTNGVVYLSYQPRNA
jgi:dihydrofolate reductase